ncbi:MAG: hypothetical protein JNL70_02540 [Saprospiraceae bacterium]|nr:hypothetical protein [Saprospiraceae bacterium]
MKKTMLMLSILFFFSCNSDGNFDPIGEWYIKEADLDIDIGGNSLSEEGKQTLTIFMSTYKNSIIEEMKRKGKLEFFADKTYKAVFSEDTDTGKYSVINDGHTISTTSDTDKKTDLMAVEEEATDKTRLLIFQMPLNELTEMKHIEKTEYGDIEVGVKRLKIIFVKKVKNNNF